jgi:hypothetical protein
MPRYFDRLPDFAIGPLQVGAREATDVGLCTAPGLTLADGVCTPLETDPCPDGFAHVEGHCHLLGEAPCSGDTFRDATTGRCSRMAGGDQPDEHCSPLSHGDICVLKPRYACESLQGVFTEGGGCAISPADAADVALLRHDGGACQPGYVLVGDVCGPAAAACQPEGERCDDAKPCCTGHSCYNGVCF